MLKDIIPPAIENLSPYVPGKLIEEVEEELGLTGIIKLASNENSLGPSPKAMAAIAAALGGLGRYGDADSRSLKKALAAKYGFSPENILIGNGSSEFILILAHAFLAEGLNAVMSRPSFTLYAQNARAAGAQIREVPLTPDFGHDLEGILKNVDGKTRLVFLDNPLNPTGAFLTPEAIINLLRRLPQTCLLVLDEAYVEFSRLLRPDYKALIADGRVVVMRTFSKIYGLAGLRAAYALMSKDIIGAINKVRQPFNMNLLAQVGVLAALEDDGHLTETIKFTQEGLNYLTKELTALGLKCYPSQANFLMAEVDKPADDIFKALLREGIIVRSLSSFGLKNHLRFTVGLPNENAALIKALQKVFNQ